ncbi:hypothetical protein KA005_01825, partial [bacterium]|nr:hypothetical protein [bacterium]
MKNCSSEQKFEKTDFSTSDFDKALEQELEVSEGGLDFLEEKLNTTLFEILQNEDQINELLSKEDKIANNIQELNTEIRSIENEVRQINLNNLALRFDEKDYRRKVDN